MDEELKTHLEAMEGRLMQRITGLQEQTLERFRSVDQHFSTMTAALTNINTTMQVIVMLLGDFAKRITDLEKKP